MADIIHRIGIRAPADRVYAALATIDGLSGWWTRDTRGDPRPGGTITFGFQGAGGETLGSFPMEVVEQVPDRLVRWRVKAPAASPDWVDTEVEFDLSPQGEMTVVRFGHRRWREASEGMAHCSMKWATFLLSLRALVETGSGRPAPEDLKIDNWN